MAQYIIDSSDGRTEALLIDYRNERGGVQAIAGQMYVAIARCEEAYRALEGKLQPGEEYADLSEYHTALQAPVADAVAMLRDSMAGVMALMEQMQTAMPEGVELFPGVPRR